jgi:RNA polymerase sigma-70 factor (ECF subfamily)
VSAPVRTTGGNTGGDPTRADAAPERVDPFVAERPRLWSLAYRMTGSRADADDVVQDTWLRWRGTERAAVERPAAWLTTAASRLALDRLRARERERRAYVGPWLPDPVPAPAATPEAAAELADSLTFGFLALLERLGPVERVVFLLADVFGEPYAAIAPIVDRSEVACRQIAHRARQRVRQPAGRRPAADRRATPPAAAEGVEQLASAFARAAGQGDLAALTDLLAPDVVLLSDGGPRRRAARHPIVGSHRVGRLLAHLVRRTPPGAAVEVVPLDGGEAVVVRGPAGAQRAVVVEPDDDGRRIARLFVVVNPEKLRAL